MESKVSPQFEAEVAVLLVAQVAEVQPFVQVAAVVWLSLQAPSGHSWCRIFVRVQAVYRILYRMAWYV